MILKDNLDYKVKKNQNLIEEIINIEYDINKLQMIFLDDESNLDKFEIVNKISFNKEKLEVLSKIVTNNNLKIKCDSILRNIIAFIEKYNLEEYSLKIKTLNFFTELTKNDNQIPYLEIKNKLGKLAINLTLEDESEELIDLMDVLDFPDLNLHLMIKDLRDNKMGIFENINSFFKKEDIPDKNRLGLEEKELFIQDLLDSLFEFISNSYEVSKEPFSKYEKIIIVGTIIDIQEYLS